MIFMKRLFFCLPLMFCLPLVLFAQQKFKFGEVSKEDVSMTVYAKDTTASAVVLYENSDSYYSINAIAGDFEITTDYVVRIKVLTTEGTDCGNISIPFYQGSTRVMQERITGLAGNTYNLEGDKIVKDKLSKDFVFVEDVTENHKLQKFAMPSVKVGSVFEYKYTITSPFYYTPEDFTFQRNIPVKFSQFSIKIPQYFIFNREMKGYEYIDMKIEKENQNLTFGTQHLTCTAEHILATVRDLPAMKSEPFVWCRPDFLSGIRLEINRVEIPGVYYKNYSQTWGDVCMQLNESDNFGKQLKQKGLFKDEMQQLFSEGMTDEAKIRAVLDLVRSKVKWNDAGKLFVENMKKALKEGVGSSAEINALLCVALRDAGYDVLPAVMSLRSKGRIPFTYPGLSDLNYFIVQVKLGEKTIYLDATLPYTDINIIPVDCMVDRAMVVHPNNLFEWVDLTNISKNVQIVNILAEFNEEGHLNGKYSSLAGGANAFVFFRNFKKADNQEKYIEELQNKTGMRVENYEQTSNRTNTASVSEVFQFKSNWQLGDDLITFNPMIFPDIKNNDFKSESRIFPIEFPYPTSSRINVMLTLPEGYAVEELPAPEKFVSEDNTLSVSFNVGVVDGKLQLIYQFNLGTCIMPATDYVMLREFWAKMVAKNNEVVVLKKL